jgi:hypothetical protein
MFSDGSENYIRKKLWSEIERLSSADIIMLWRENPLRSE